MNTIKPKKIVFLWPRNFLIFFKYRWKFVTRRWTRCFCSGVMNPLHQLLHTEAEKLQKMSFIILLHNVVVYVLVLFIYSVLAFLAKILDNLEFLAKILDFLDFLAINIAKKSKKNQNLGKKSKIMPLQNFIFVSFFIGQARLRFT